MHRVFLVCIMILSVLGACNADKESIASQSKSLSFSEVGEKDLNNDVLKFVHDVQEDGVHLYYEGKKTMYVCLNGTQAAQGGKAVHYSDFNVEEEGDTLNISYKEAETTDHSNKKTQTLTANHLYEIDLNKKYEKVKGFRNGEEAPFNIVSGNGE
jgi:hypothetical protein